MISGGINIRERTNLVLLERHAIDYRDNILQHVVPYAQRYDPNPQLMHDNGCLYLARLTSAFLEDQEVNVLPWPAQSPHLNPFEHVWDIY